VSGQSDFTETDLSEMFLGLLFGDGWAIWIFPV